jgi:quaternary ammonium compound-resistance protein SugE
VLTVIAMIASVLLLEYAVRTIAIGTAYAVWTGIGAVGTVIGGMMLFGEPGSVARLACIALVILGIVGLRVLSVQ